MGFPRRQARRNGLGAVGLVAVGLVLVIAVAGCSSGSDHDTAKTSPPASAISTTRSGSGSGATPAASGSSIPVIAEQKNLAVPNQTGDSMSVGVRSLTVDPNGTTMTLRLVFTPQFTSKPDQDVTLGDLAPGSFVRPDLLDRVHLKRYDVIAANNKDGFLESPSGTGAPNGQPFEAWFVYAAPQDPVSSLDVSVLDSWPPFTNVPVQQ